MKKRTFLLDVLIGILFTLFFISLGVVLVINFRALYRFDISYLNIEETSGLSKDVILDNYNALIDYCSPFFTKPLQFPTLPASEAGLFHFEECKVLFNAFYAMLPVTGILLAGAIIYKRKQNDISYLAVSSATCVILPLFVAGACAMNFDRTFVVFHQLFFNNDYWLFDPLTDPIINLLPEAFFLHCAIFIVAIVILGSITLFGFYCGLKKHSQKN